MFNHSPSQLLDGSSAVTAIRCDISRAEDIVNALSITTSAAPLGRAFHAGGLLKDGIMMKQTVESVRAVLAPKLGFLQHASAIMTAQPINQLNLFSSVSAFLGSPGQANYAAANMVLDRWAQCVQQSGLAGSSVGWGAWGEVGMAHGNTALLTRVEQSGLGVVRPEAGLSALNTVLEHVSTGRLVHSISSPFSFTQLTRGLQEVPEIFAAVLHQDEDPPSAFSEISSAMQNAPLSASSLPLQGTIIDTASLVEDIQSSVAGLLGVTVAPDQPLMEAGIDSLSAVELRNELGTRFGVTMPATVMFDYPTVNSLAGFVASRTQPTQQVARPTAEHAVVSSQDGTREAPAFAVYGISCRYPGSVRGMEDFFNAASRAADLPETVPCSRWDIDRFYSPWMNGNESIYTRFGAFLDDVENFDASLFWLPKAEAVATDPQQRVLLEETHGVLLSAQTALGPLQGTSTGTFFAIQTMQKRLRYLEFRTWIYFVDCSF